MIKSYFTIALRNLLRNKGYSFINIGGLATGMAIAMLIGLWIVEEVSFDGYHPNQDRIVRVMQHQTYDGATNTYRNLPMPVGNTLRNEYGNDFTYVAMSSWERNHVLNAGEVSINQVGSYVEYQLPRIFDVKMIEGSVDALKDPSSIILSSQAAKSLFGDKDPMNQFLKLDSRFDVKVAGIFEKLPLNSTMGHVDFFVSWEVFLKTEPWIANAITRWGNNSFQAFALVAPNADIGAVSEKIKFMKSEHDEVEKIFNPILFLQPMSDWHLRSKFENGVLVGGQIDTVWMFGIIGAFVLLLACINFMNLSTARSEKRAKEVGVRMTMGSVRFQLISQFLSESFLVVLIAFVIALVVTVLSLPWFNDLAAKKISIPWLSFYFWFGAATFIVFTSLLAGSYPALFLSSFKPVKVLKGVFRAGRAASLPRKILVVIQFAVSVSLAIGTIIVYQQIDYSKNRPVGYSREGLILVEMTSLDFKGKFDALKNELAKSNAVVEMAESSSPTYATGAYNGGFTWEGMDPALEYSDFGSTWINPEYGKTIGWKIKEGRDVSREFSSDSTAMLINEAAAKFMGFKDPIGKRVTWDSHTYTIVGVVADMLTDSPYQNVKPNVWFVDYGDINWINLRMNPAMSLQESLEHIKSAFNKVIPNVPFAYKFADDVYAKKFDAEVRIGKLVSVFAVLAIIICCLGIFGLASFVAEQRTKEIGVRKVLGASIASLWTMLSKDFVFLVIIASTIAIPTALYFLDNWLKSYVYRTTIDWWMPVVILFGALVVTLLTVSYQAIRAANANPVKSLRSE